jgi:hypothetical protein
VEPRDIFVRHAAQDHVGPEFAIGGEYGTDRDRATRTSDRRRVEGV